MNWDNIAAHPTAKQFLLDSIEEQRISHAQLFVGKAGYGTLALALTYAKNILCQDNNMACQQRVESLQHTDLHMVFPTFKIDKTEALSKNYYKEFRPLVLENPYLDLQDWYVSLDAGNKQAFISGNEIQSLAETLSLKSYEGGYKILIMWNADKLRTDAANKFLKLLEEPPPKTLIILITESEEKIIDTIRSRCQTVYFKPLDTEMIAKLLSKMGDEKIFEIERIAQQANGDYREALQLFSNMSNNIEFEENFMEWTRNAFQVKTKLIKLQDLINQAEKMASWNKEYQKKYIQYCLNTFRKALLQNYQLSAFDFHSFNSKNFNFEAFSRFINGENIYEIMDELNSTYFYLERNANSKLCFVNLALKLTRLLHKN